MTKNQNEEDKQVGKQYQARRNLLDTIDSIRSNAYERAGSQVCQIFAAARHEIERIATQSMSGQGLRGYERKRFLRQLLQELQKRNTGMDFAADQIERMLNKDKTHF